MATTLFLSHNTADLNVVAELQRRAAAFGATLYTYEADIRAGTSLPEKLVDAIRRSDGVIAILTRDGVTRPAIQQEIGAAVALKKPVYALIEDGVDVASLTLLQGLEYIRLQLDRIGDAITALEQSVLDRNRKEQAALIAIVITAVLAILALRAIASA